MRPRPNLEPLLLAAAIVITRYPFRSHLLYDLDSVNFALGMKHFDPMVHQPHPPGYFLYVLLGRAVNALVHDPNLALVLISIAASCGTVILIYRIGLEWFGRDAALFAGLLFLFSPLAWFHGEVALTYSVEAFFSALLGYLCWRILQGESHLAVWAAITLGACVGFRPSSSLFLTPLFLFSIRRLRLKTMVLPLGALAATIAAWFFPMIAASGGFGAYFGALTFLWDTVPAKHTLFDSSPVYSIARAATIAEIIVLMFGAMLLTPLIAMGRTQALPEDPLRRAKALFTLVWVVPALLFFTFIFLKFVNSGYLLLLAPAGCLWLGFLIASSFRSAGVPGWQKAMALTAAAALNTLIFLAAPLYCSWRSIHNFETNLTEIQRALPAVASEPDTLVLTFDSHFLGFRHAGYYLPGYFTIEYPELKMKHGVRVFSMRGRSTRLLRNLPLTQYQRFVIFPLPEGPGYRQYEQEVLSKLPARDLQSIHVGGKTFITGPIQDLPRLFPEATQLPKNGVYAAMHLEQERVNNR